MTLQEILFGKFEPPAITSNRITHYIGLDSNHRYISPIKKVRERKEINDSEAKILKIMKAQVKPITPAEIEKKTPWTRNHCNVIMGGLCKKGLLKRHRVVIGNSRTFAYEYKKEPQCTTL